MGVQELLLAQEGKASEVLVSLDFCKGMIHCTYWLDRGDEKRISEKSCHTTLLESIEWYLYVVRYNDLKYSML